MIEKNDISVLMKAVADVVRRYVSAAVSELATRLAAMESAVKALPAGKDGAPGRDGKDGANGIDGKDGAPGVQGAPGKDGRDGVDGKDGAAGLDGKDGAAGREGAAGKDGAAGRDGINGKDGASGADGQAGKDGAPGARGANGENGAAGKDGLRGQDGKDGQPGAKGDAGERGKDGRDGIDGRSAYQIAVEKGYQGTEMEWLDALHGAPGAAGKDGRDGREGKDGKDGRDGEKGRDAFELEVVPTIDVARSYPRGTVAEFRGGLVRSVRTTDPVAEDLASAGWSVILRGIDTETEELKEDGRLIVRTTAYTCGRKLVREIRTAAVLDRGVYRPDAEYAKGDGVTWAGSWWIAQIDKPTDKPGISEQFRLAVKRGRDGKDAT